MRNVSYKDLYFPVSYEFCYGRVVELYTHPGITAEQLDVFAKDVVSISASSSG